jgi:hypothetical protein
MLSDPTLQLFSLCTRLEQTPALRLQVIEAVARISIWDGIASQAEKHGMAPLLDHHLRMAGATIADNTRRELAGLALRHRLINQARTRILGELVTSAQEAGIPLLVLKGAALAHLLYPEPGLRPMKDVDILVRRSDLEHVTGLFEKAGFLYSKENVHLEKKRHLPDFNRQADGFSIAVEAHYSLFMDAWSRPWGDMEDLLLPAVAFPLAEGISGQTLSYEETLLHLCRHAFFDNHSLEPLCMIWAADICNFAEKFADETDWTFLAQTFPLVQHTLSTLQEMIPLSDHLLTTAQLAGRRNRWSAVKAYQGWPGAPLKNEKRDGVFYWMKETIFPSAWWLFLRYGSKVEAPVWYYWARHIINLCGEALRRTVKRIKNSV